MLIYFVALAIVSATALLLRRSGSRASTVALYVVILLPMVLVPGLRSRLVGTDAGNYVAMFERQDQLSQAFEGSLEPGFYLLSWVAHLFSDDYVSIFLVIALVVAVCFVWTIGKCSRIPWLSFFVFFVSGAFAVSINGARQGLAVAFVFVGYRALLARRFWWFACCVAVASLFHVTAIVALPAYLVGLSRNRLWARLAILVVGGVGLVAFERLVGLAGTVEERFSVYGEVSTEGRGLLVLGFLLALCVVFFLFRHVVTTDSATYDVLLDLFVLGAVIAGIATLQGTGASGVRRLSLYFLASEILLWPLVFREIRNPFSRVSLQIVFATVYLIYFGLTLRAFSNLTPYSVNPIVADWVPFL